MKITTNVEPEWDDIKKKYGWTWKELIGLGLKAKKDNPSLIKRINEMESRIHRLERRL